MRKTVFLCLFCLLLVCLALPIGAAQFEMIDDRAELVFSVDQLQDEEADGTETYGVRYFLLTDTAREPLSDSEVLTRCGIGRKDDAAVLLVRYTGGTYYYDMYTWGLANDALSNADIDRILDDSAVYNNLKEGNISVGAGYWRARCADRVADYAAKQAKREAGRIPRGIAAMAVSFFVAGGIAMLCVALSYRKRTHGEIYPLERYARLDLQLKSDRFVGSYITRVRIRSNNSGGGGGHGGGHSGGGHRGGR